MHLVGIASGVCGLRSHLTRQGERATLHIIALRSENTTQLCNSQQEISSIISVFAGNGVSKDRNGWSYQFCIECNSKPNFRQITKTGTLECPPPAVHNMKSASMWRIKGKNGCLCYSMGVWGAFFILFYFCLHLSTYREANQIWTDFSGGCGLLQDDCPHLSDMITHWTDWQGCKSCKSWGLQTHQILTQGGFWSDVLETQTEGRSSDKPGVHLSCTATCRIDTKGPCWLVVAQHLTNTIEVIFLLLLFTKEYNYTFKYWPHVDVHLKLVATNFIVQSPNTSWLIDYIFMFIFLAKMLCNRHHLITRTRGEKNWPWISMAKHHSNKVLMS